MRYSDFKLVESKLKEEFDANDPNSIRVGMNITSAMLPYLPDDVEGGRLTQDQVDYMRQRMPTASDTTSAEPEQNGLHSGPPYPPEDMERVRAMQTRLEELGYSVGSTGIDGKYGPRTSRAVRAFKQDNNIPTPNVGRSMSEEELDRLATASPVDNPRPTGNEGPQGGSARYDLAPLSQSDVQGRVGDILDFIARYESAGQYDKRNGGTRDPRILDMTIAQILQYQLSAPWPGGESSAIGRYQYVRSTLRDTSRQMGLDINSVKFNEETQDQLAIYTLRQSCGLDRWLNSNGDEDATTAFINRVAQIWSAIPQSNNRSAHLGIGSNRRGLDFSDALAQVTRIHSSAAS